MGTRELNGVAEIFIQLKACDNSLMGSISNMFDFMSNQNKLDQKSAVSEIEDNIFLILYRKIFV